MKFYNDPKTVAKTPIATVFLLEYANFGQLWRMWHEHTAAGQNLFSWVSVWLALVLWLNFYRVIAPEQKFAFWCTLVGIVVNTTVCITVAYFRYFYQSP